MTPVWMRAAAAVLLFVTGGAAGFGVARTRAGSGVPALASVNSVEEANEALRQAEQNYMDLLVVRNQLVEQDGGAQSADPATRYAALDYLVDAGRAALRQAPADPFLNGFVVTVAAERQAQLRRLSAGSGNWF
jgi:hypothetical protein